MVAINSLQISEIIFNIRNNTKEVISVQLNLRAHLENKFVRLDFTRADLGIDLFSARGQGGRVSVRLFGLENFSRISNPMVTTNLKSKCVRDLPLPTHSGTHSRGAASS